MKPILSLAALIVLGLSAPAAHAADAVSSPEIHEVLDPRGIWPEIRREPLAPRVTDLRGRTVYIVNSWTIERSGFGPVIEALEIALAQRYPGVRVRVTDRNTLYSDDDPKLWETMRTDAAAFIYIGAASSSTTAYAFKWGVGLEKMGIPGVVAMYDTLLSVARTVQEREGMPLRYVSFGYPVEAMPADAMQAGVAAVVDALSARLTSEEQRSGALARPPAPDVFFRGTFDEVQQHLRGLGLTDGLPVVPPTRERVDAMLRGTSHPPGKLLTTKMPPQELGVTVEKVAIIGVMAGCDPSHMPVLLASLEAFLKMDRNAVIRSTGSFGFMQVVNGPIRGEIGMHAGTHVLGPGNHANSAIGRALRLYITNLGGGVPGENLMGVIGTLAAWPFLFAEFEEQSPWESLSVTRGWKPQDSTLTMFFGGWSHSGNYGHVRFGLDQVAEDLAEFENARGAAVIISPKRAEMLAAEGMSKEDVRRYLNDGARRSLEFLRRSSFYADTQETMALDASTVVAVNPPGSVEVIVAGGDASPMMQAWHMNRPVTVSIDAWR